MATKLAQKVWTDFKALVTQRGLYIYEIKNDADCYILQVSDAQHIVETVIEKTNTTEKDDYENNYRGDISKVFHGTNFE